MEHLTKLTPPKWFNGSKDFYANLLKHEGADSLIAMLVNHGHLTPKEAMEMAISESIIPTQTVWTLWEINSECAIELYVTAKKHGLTPERIPEKLCKELWDRRVYGDQSI